MDFAAVRDWPGYFQAVQGKPARETLVHTLGLFDAEGFGPGLAADLGCGEGRDTAELLRRGWQVVAIDGEAAAFEHLGRRIPPEHTGRVRMVRSALEDAEWGEVDLLNASFTLPFCDPARFGDLWARIVASIRPGGRFAGQFFGDRDTWARCADRTHHTREQVEALLAGFDLELFNEEERDDAMADGAPKHWHVFHIVAHKKNDQEQGGP
jgi:tellurite methyltransferase